MLAYLNTKYPRAVSGRAPDEPALFVAPPSGTNGPVRRPRRAVLSCLAWVGAAARVWRIVLFALLSLTF